MRTRLGPYSLLTRSIPAAGRSKQAVALGGWTTIRETTMPTCLQEANDNMSLNAMGIPTYYIDSISSFNLLRFSSAATIAPARRIVGRGHRRISVGRTGGELRAHPLAQ